MLCCIHWYSNSFFGIIEYYSNDRIFHAHELFEFRVEVFRISRIKQCQAWASFFFHETRMQTQHNFIVWPEMLTVPVIARYCPGKLQIVATNFWLLQSLTERRMHSWITELGVVVSCMLYSVHNCAIYPPSETKRSSRC